MSETINTKLTDKTQVVKDAKDRVIDKTDTYNSPEQKAA